ncbi:hypothetical protein GCM10025874_07500 [Arenivirga flava]|uniref:Ferric uptake regulation protein n=1 Tax=Arenivirga flava TaxID=1930060 RepID=A0AA37XBJ7_9MICO|nr:hypothetical protein GCM10025874_07500 [Arenivirga flava]
MHALRRRRRRRLRARRSPCLEPSDASGFTITTAEVTFWGLCAACGSAEAGDTEHPSKETDV